MAISKISTNLMFDRASARLSALQARLTTTQAQLAQSKQILSPSDAPPQAAAIQRLRGEIDRQDSHAATLKTALNRYSAEETALKSSSDVLQRLKELSVQAANDTLGPDDRRVIAVEVDALRKQLLTLGNTRDDNGNYLFSGTRVKTPAFAEDAEGNVTYQGDQTQTSIPAGVERSVTYTRAGSDVFARVLRQDAAGATSAVGFFKSLEDFAAALRANERSGVARAVSELDQMLQSVNLALAENGADQQVVASQVDVLDQAKLRLKSSLSTIEDLDYTEAAARMTKEMTALQAAMSSFSKIAGLSLFDHLK